MCALEMLLELQQQALAIDSVAYDDDDSSNISVEYVADDIAEMEMGESQLIGERPLLQVSAVGCA